MCPVSRGTSRSKLALETGTAKLWLLLVGVSQYQDEQLPPLHYPALDCQGLAEALAEATQGFPQKEVLIHHDLAARRPELNTVRASLQHIAAAAQPQDTIVFYFSGHGILQGRPAGLSAQQAMLCLTDTQKNNLLNTGLGLQEVLHTLGKSAAGQQLVWLDACHSGGMTLLGAKGGADDSLNPTSQLVEILRQRAAQSKGFYALLSCDQAQQSWEFPELGHGVFTYYLMQGLRGEAADAQGVIEADGLYRYVYHQTMQYIDRTNQQLRLMNQQKRSRGETQLYPEYPLQTPKRIVEGVGELILGLKPTGGSLCSVTQGVTVTAIQGVDELLRTAEGSGGSGVRLGKMATPDVGEAMSESKSSAAIETATDPPTVSQTVKPRRHPRLRTILLASVVITTLVMGVRYLGLLQTKELQAFDGLMRLRPDEKPDSRLLVVTITEEDIQAQNQEARKGSLSDRSLAQLLQKLNQYQPIAIGLDLYRDFPTDSNQKNLAKLLQDERLIGVCKVSDPESHDPGVRPPLEIPPERLGFSDFSTDPDGVLRRQLLALNPGPASPCTTPYALSTQLAFRYLDAKGISPKFTPEKNLQLGKVVFKHLEAHTGGYQQLDARGHQVLLNYRSSQDIAPQVTLKQVLTGQLAPSYVKDRVVLIGVTAPSAGDYWSTPNTAAQATDPQMSGVFVQAQMLSQILSAVLDGRSLLWVWPVWSEALWVWGWSLVGGAIAWRCRSLLHLGLAAGVAQGTLYGFCFCLLITQSCWIPLVPAAIALIATGSSVVVYTQISSRRHRIHPSFYL